MVDTHQVYENYLQAICEGDRRLALHVARTSLAAGMDLRDLYMDVFQPAMHEVGRLWETNQLTVAQEHLATAMTQSVMAHLHAYIVPQNFLDRTMVATCIGGELHELGIRMVADFFEIEGWEVYYLGANMPYDDVIGMIEDKQADLLAISVTLNSHVSRAQDMIQAVRASTVGKRIKIMVGGQPINRRPEIYHKIGADFTAINARESVQRAMEAVSAIPRMSLI